MQNSLWVKKNYILKFNSLSNIHVFKFAFGCLFHILLSKHTKCSLRQPNFYNFPGECAPRHPWRFALPAFVWSVSHPLGTNTCLRAWIARSYVSTPWKGGEKWNLLARDYSSVSTWSAHRRNLSAQNQLGLNKSCRKPQIITSNNTRFVHLLSNANHGGLFEEWG